MSKHACLKCGHECHCENHGQLDHHCTKCDCQSCQCDCKKTMGFARPSAGKTIGCALLILIFIFVAVLVADLASQLITPRVSQNVNAVLTNKQDAFSVTGTAQLEAIPDQAEVRLGISTSENSVANAQTKVNTIINNLTTSLLDLGINQKDIQTSDYSIYPNYDWSDSSQGQRIIGYSANSSVVITVQDFEKINQIIDLATQAGINQINGISFNLSADKKAEVLKEARAVGIKDAQANATELANLTGMQLGKIIDVQETNSNNSVSPLTKFSANQEALDLGGAGGTDISAGSTLFNYQVVISYETLN